MKDKFLTQEEFFFLPKYKRTGYLQHADESIHWYKEGKRHRDDGPAINYANGDKYWYKEGKRHREDGPAVEYPDGEIQYWLNDEYYSYTEWYAIVNGLEKFI